MKMNYFENAKTTFQSSLFWIDSDATHGQEKNWLTARTTGLLNECAEKIKDEANQFEKNTKIENLAAGVNGMEKHVIFENVAGARELEHESSKGVNCADKIETAHGRTHPVGEVGRPPQLQSVEH